MDGLTPNENKRSTLDLVVKISVLVVALGALAFVIWTAIRNRAKVRFTYGPTNNGTDTPPKVLVFGSTGISEDKEKGQTLIIPETLGADTYMYWNMGYTGRRWRFQFEWFSSHTSSAVPGDFIYVRVGAKEPINDIYTEQGSGIAVVMRDGPTTGLDRSVTLGTGGSDLTKTLNNFTFALNTWNKTVVELQGNSLTVTLNGVSAAPYVYNFDQSGSFIIIRASNDGGANARWIRNVKFISLG